jgi:hypothetical protein
MSHNCEGFVIHCMDFRLQDYINAWIAQNFRSADRVSIPGSVLAADTVMDALRTSVLLHSPSKVALIAHEDCGGYGGKGTHDRLVADLRAMRDRISAEFPRLKISCYVLSLHGDFEPVD